MLDGVKLEKLYLVLENEEKQFQQLLNELNSYFISASDRIALVSTLVVLLSEPRLFTSPGSCILALYFLYSLVPSNPPPWIPAFSRIYSLYLGTGPSSERSLVIFLLCGLSQKLKLCTVRYWLRNGASCVPNMSQMGRSKSLFVSRIAQLDCGAGYYIPLDPSVVDEILISSGAPQPSGVPRHVHARKLFRRLCERLSLKLFGIPDPGDETDSVEMQNGDSIQSLTRKFSQLLEDASAALMDNQQNRFFVESISPRLDELGSQVCMLPKLLPGFIQHNPNLATQILRRELQGENVSVFLDTLLCVPVSINFMEVIYGCLDCIQHDFIANYISDAIQRCNKEPEGSCTEEASLLCIFIKGLIDRNFVLQDELLYEVETLCISFSDLKVATDLFKYVLSKKV